MLTKKLACPSCGVHLKVANTLPPGKIIKCPKCSKPFPVPEDNEPLKVESEPAKKGIPLAESPAPKTALAKRRKAPRPPEDDSDGDGEAKAQRVSKKRRKQRKQTSSNTPLLVGLAIAAAVLVIGAGVAGLIWWRSSANKNPPLAQNSPPPPGPGMAAPEASRPRGPRGPRPAVATPEPVPPRTEAGPAPSPPAQVAEVSDRSSNGQALFEAKCTRCHGMGGGPGRGRGNRGPDLSHVGARRTVDWLVTHIRDPRSHNANSRMPAFEDQLSEDELRSLAEYLASLK
jgi:mono/diheme cytochrome c family protein